MAGARTRVGLTGPWAAPAAGAVASALSVTALVGTDVQITRLIGTDVIVVSGEAAFDVDVFDPDVFDAAPLVETTTLIGTEVRVTKLLATY